MRVCECVRVCAGVSCVGCVHCEHGGGVSDCRPDRDFRI